MLGPRQAKQFIDENRDALNILGSILKEANSVRSARYAKYSFESRALAILMVEEWIQQVFGIAFETERFSPNDDGIITRLTAESRDSD